MKQREVLVMGTLLALALAQPQALTTDTPTPNFITENKVLVTLILLLALLAAAIYLDKRNGSRYMTILRQRAVVLWQRAQQLARRRMQLKTEKLSGEEAIPTSKEMQTNIFDSEKTYVEADLNSIQETALERKLEGVSSLELCEETPKVNLREVFEQKDKDGQASKKSKSKIRSRVQIKKSERESEDSQETKESKEGNSFEISAREE